MNEKCVIEAKALGLVEMRPLRPRAWTYNFLAGTQCEWILYSNTILFLLFLNLIKMYCTLCGYFTRISMRMIIQSLQPTAIFLKMLLSFCFLHFHLGLNYCIILHKYT